MDERKEPTPFPGSRKPEPPPPPPHPRPEMGAMRIQAGDVILTADLFNSILDALIDIGTNAMSVDAQRKCRLIAEQLIAVLGRR